MSDDEQKPASAAASPRKRGKRPALKRTGDLWAKCPECRMPIKDADLFRHLLTCPGAEARQAEWTAQQAAVKPDLKPDPEAQAQ
jgi:acetyl-CoA carboxylase beta subunit